ELVGLAGGPQLGLGRTPGRGLAARGGRRRAAASAGLLAWRPRRHDRVGPGAPDRGRSANSRERCLRRDDETPGRAVPDCRRDGPDRAARRRHLDGPPFPAGGQGELAPRRLRRRGRTERPELGPPAGRARRNPPEVGRKPAYWNARRGTIPYS